MTKREITLNFADIDKAVEAFEWVCEEYTKQSRYQGGYTYPHMTQKQKYCIWMELVPDFDDRPWVWEQGGYQRRDPRARIEFKARPLREEQKVTLYVSALKPSDPKTASWLRIVEEIFEAFRIYMQEAGCVDQKRRKGAPLLEERADVEEKREKARKYLERWAQGVSKELAAQFVGHSRKTLNGYVIRLLSPSEIEGIVGKELAAQFIEKKARGRE